MIDINRNTSFVLHGSKNIFQFKILHIDEQLHIQLIQHKIKLGLGSNAIYCVTIESIIHIAIKHSVEKKIQVILICFDLF